MTEFERPHIINLQVERARREHAIITPELLFEDNHSSEAQESMGQWIENYRNGNIILVWKCSDARVVNPSPINTMVLATVAATDDPRTYSRLLAEAPFKAAAVIGHFGCGALGEKRKMDEEQGNELKKGIFKRVEEKIETHDEIIQTRTSARHVAGFTTRPVIGIVQNHRTLENHTVGIYGSSEDEQASTIAELIQNSQQRKEELFAENPQLYETQEVQNPTTIVLTTDPQPIEVRYPNLFGKPNSAFQLLVPRESKSLEARIPIKGLRIAADHSQYPTIHAIQNYEKGGAFADTNTIFIETKLWTKSEYIAGHLLGRQFIADFLSLSPDHQIIIGETRKGKLQENVTIFA